MKNNKQHRAVSSITSIVTCALLTMPCLQASHANPGDSQYDQAYHSKRHLTEREVLKHLLIAELAAKRGMPQVALDNYMLVAQSTQDPEVAQLATEFAIEQHALKDALQAARIWADADTQDMQAQLVVVTLLVRTSPNQAIPYLTRTFEIDPSEVDQHLLSILNKLTPASRKHLTDITFRIAANRPKDPYAQLAAAQVAANQLDIVRAKERLDLCLQLRPNLSSAIELQAKIIRHESNDDQPALNYLEQQIAKYPNNNKLRMFYITALNDNNQHAKTIPHLKALAEDKEYGGDALLMLGEYYITLSEFDTGAGFITRALKHDDSKAKAKYYLGQIAEFKNNDAKAIEWYTDINDLSVYHVSAALRASTLLSDKDEHQRAISVLRNTTPATFAEQKQLLLAEIDVLLDAEQYEQALSTSSQSLGAVPDDLDFLYAHSIVASMLNQHDLAEEALRKILTLDPNHANALNALGFTLTHHPERLEEAMPFLEKAMALVPNNPAFMDSMGWLLFRMGKLKESLAMLQDAYSLSNDGEIAAHLGEVMWTMGKKEDAREILRVALDKNPEHTILLETTKRLKIKLPQTSAKK